MFETRECLWTEWKTNKIIHYIAENSIKHILKHFIHNNDRKEIKKNSYDAINTINATHTM